MDFKHLEWAEAPPLGGWEVVKANVKLQITNYNEQITIFNYQIEYKKEAQVLPLGS